MCIRDSSDGTVKRYLSDGIDALERVLGPMPGAYDHDIALIRNGD